MRQLLFLMFLLTNFKIQSQVFFSKVYTVSEDGTGLLNIWPNYLTSVFPTDSLIYAFGYSSDTTYKEIYGTGFFVFDLKGDLLEYFHIKDSQKYNFFGPEGIHTWDGITFYTAFNNFYHEESILKFNRISKAQEVLEIKNSKIKNGDILRSNMIGINDGCLVTASDIAIDSTGYNYKIQITKIDTNGKIKWQSIVGKEPGNAYNNHCFSTYADLFGNIYVGVGFSDPSGVGSKADYQSLFYKLDSNGNTKKEYSTQLAREGFNQTYDIAQDSKGWFYLSSDYNWNEPQYPYGNIGYGAIQILDSNLNYKSNIKLNFDSTLIAPAWVNSFEKIIRANDNAGFVIGGSLPYCDTVISYIDSLSKFDTISRSASFITILKLNDNKQIEWRRIYRIRNGFDHGYLHDLKPFPNGGYIIGAESIGLPYDENKDPIFKPWLLKIDNDGCLIPGCNIVNNKDQTSDLSNHLMIYPNPASNYIVILHPNTERIKYQIVSYDGKIIDEFYSFIENEQIIVPLSNYASGTYLIKTTNKFGSVGSKTFIKN